MRIRAVGLGGIGSALLPVLCRFLNFSKRESAEIDLIDGDNFQEKNAERQTFDRLGNKAVVTAEMLEKRYGMLEFTVTDEYVSPGNVIRLIREREIVFLMVDNHATRKLVSDRCQELDDVLLLSGGNDYTNGNVQVHWRKEGKDLTLPIANPWHPEIMSPKDKNPAEMSCQELTASGEPQLLLVNQAIATTMLNAFYAYLEGKLIYDEVYVDILTNNVRQVVRRNQAA